MRPTLRKLFLIVSAFGYGFLGCGPSLWALDVNPPDRIMDCLRMGCTCRLHPGQKGAVCCCLAKRALLRKYPALVTDAAFWRALGLDPPRPAGTCQLEPDGCGIPGGHGVGPVPVQPHFPSRALFRPRPALGPAPFLPSDSGRSEDPEAPKPRPD